MLINFTVGNYRSFKEKKTLNMEATSIKELKESVVVKDGYKLLPTAVVYGANSSGKSNLLNAILKFKEIVINSSKQNSTDKLDMTPFLLNEKTAKEPSYFEIELLCDTATYTYGFVVDNNKVFEEWLYRKEKDAKNEKCLFVRTEEGIGVTDDYPEGKGLEERTRSNGLFLSVVDAFNGGIAQELVKQIANIWIISGINHEYMAEVTTRVFSLFGNFEEAIGIFSHQLNLGFNKLEIPKDVELAKKIKAYTSHSIYNNSGQPSGQIQFNMNDHESAGTNKLFDLLALFIIGLATGSTIIIDELDSKLHPLITRQIVSMFNTPATNTGGGQLIFSTHDVNLLTVKTLRRDQIWFTEKDQTEATDLYSLVEFREPDGTKIRNDRSFEKDYINGRYGAIPYIKS